MTEVEGLVEQETLDMSPLREILEEYKGEKGAVIPVLQKVQDVYGWLPSRILACGTTRARQSLLLFALRRMRKRNMALSQDG